MFESVAMLSVHWVGHRKGEYLIDDDADQQSPHWFPHSSDNEHGDTYGIEYHQNLKEQLDTTFTRTTCCSDNSSAHLNTPPIRSEHKSRSSRKKDNTTHIPGQKKLNKFIQRENS